MYLDDPSRDKIIIDNVTLTKINPAYMTRQISEISSSVNDGVQSHTTSLNPIRHANKAADWERKWLETFEQDAMEQGPVLKGIAKKSAKQEKWQLLFLKNFDSK